MQYYISLSVISVMMIYSIECIEAVGSGGGVKGSPVQWVEVSLIEERISY